MKRLLEPVHLPFSLPKLLNLPYYLAAPLVGGIRFAIALFLGPEAYFLSRGRVLIAICVFLVKIVFALFQQDALGRSWLLYLAVAAESIQAGISLYVGYRLANAQPTVEMVEQIDVVDEQGYLITSYEKKVSSSEL